MFIVLSELQVVVALTCNGSVIKICNFCNSYVMERSIITVTAATAFDST
jgi:hypothetical protein